MMVVLERMPKWGDANGLFKAGNGERAVRRKPGVRLFGMKPQS